MAKPSLLPAGIALQADIPAAYATILTPPALEFITSLARTFQATRAKLLTRRAERQREFDRGVKPDFLAETRNEVFVWSQKQLGIPRGTVKATVLIETILAAFEKEVFDRIMTTPNQIHRQREDVRVSAADLLAFSPQTPITETGLRLNIEVGISYLGAWLAGTGCVPIHHFMEDAATAEISRTQVWHWVRSKKGVLNDGRKITLELVRTLIPEELQRIRTTLGETLYAAGKYPLAANLFDKLVSTEPLPEFLTLFAYDRLD